jgi:fibro-slime domain-containing protein
MVEGGFSCATQDVADTQPCAANPAQQCVKVSAIYRDFKSEKETGGHPDFLYLGATDGAGRVKRWCIPNSNGPAKGNEAVERAWDVAAADLLAGRPVLGIPRTYECVFTDWSSGEVRVPGYNPSVSSPLRDFSSGAVPLPAGSTLTTVSGHASWRGPVSIVNDAASFDQWFTDNSYNVRSESTLELASIGASQYRFASAPHQATGGWFPLDPPGNTPPPGTIRMTAAGEPLECNLWPYWFPAAFAGCLGDQYQFPPSVDAAQFPGGMWVPAQQGRYHDFWFTSEVRHRFVFRPGFSVQFYGDDDVFVFVNGKLVIDLGGLHQRLPGSVSFDAAGNATTAEGGSLSASGAVTACPGTDPLTLKPTSSPADCRVRSLPLGLEAGRIYELAVFHADRHPIESNYQLTVTGGTRSRSVCTAAR